MLHTHTLTQCKKKINNVSLPSLLGSKVKDRFCTLLSQQVTELQKRLQSQTEKPEADGLDGGGDSISASAPDHRQAVSLVAGWVRDAESKGRWVVFHIENDHLGVIRASQKLTIEFTWVGQ